jgi:hypothetical protein
MPKQKDTFTLIDSQVAYGKSILWNASISIVPRDEFSLSVQLEEEKQTN